MLARGILLRGGLVAAVVALALLAFFSLSHTPKTDAAGVGPVCTFATPIQNLLPGGGSDSVTCTFNIHGTIHTLVVNFTLTPTAVPPLVISSCTLDGSAIHVGPCP